MIVERRRLRVTGTVQGVGFQPFVYGLAQRHELGGFVLNDGEGVVIEAEGAAAALDRFAAELVAQAPPLAEIASVASEPLPALGDRQFRILASDATAATAS